MPAPLPGADAAGRAIYTHWRERELENAALVILAVGMETAALYAFAGSRGVRVLCLAHVTNTMERAVCRGSWRETLDLLDRELGEFLRLRGTLDPG